MFDKEKKVFPITQGVACQWKWTYNTLRFTEGTSACCHKVKAVAIDIDNFNNFHNNPVWIEHRKMQLKGIFPQQGCEYCEHIELQGGVSDRILHNREKNLYPPELDKDLTAVVTTPRVLEVFLNNNCNLACIYCDESNSSRIEKENEKFGHTVPNTPVKFDYSNIIPINKKSKHPDLLVDKFFDYLLDNYQNLKRLQILGGEPFYQKEFYRLVEFICNNKNSDLQISVFSNLQVSKTVLQQFLITIKNALKTKKIARFDITVSIDCFGPEQEYVRYGLDLEKWKENFEYLCSQKWLYLGINNTITSMTIKTMPALLTYINELRKIKKIHHSFQIVTDRPHLHPGIMGKGFFDKDFSKINNLIKIFSETTTCEYMLGIQKSINACEESLQQQYYLKQYLNEIDRRRATTWQQTFPWLAEKLDKINYVV